MHRSFKPGKRGRYPQVPKDKESYTECNQDYIGNYLVWVRAPLVTQVTMAELADAVAEILITLVGV